jgi:hypothetical protein
VKDERDQGVVRPHKQRALSKSFADQESLTAPEQLFHQPILECVDNTFWPAQSLSRQSLVLTGAITRLPFKPDVASEERRMTFVEIVPHRSSIIPNARLDVLL